jgi:hypothetical protein
VNFPFQPRTARPTFRHRKATLDCTLATANCRIQCERGVFGPPCDPTPTPGCCDPNDPSSNPAFGGCMANAQAVGLNFDVLNAGCLADRHLCGSAYPQRKRRLSFSGTYHAAVAALTGAPCAGGSYELVITSPGTSTPVLVMDDVPPAGIFCP